MNNYKLRQQMSDEKLVRCLYAAIAEKARVLRILGERSKAQVEELGKLIDRFDKAFIRS